MVKVRFRSIRTRTMVTIVPWLLLSMFALSAISYTYSKRIIDQEINSKMEYQLHSTINNMQTILTAHSKIPESLARMIEPVGDRIDKGKYFQIIQGLLSTNPDTFGVGIWYEPYQYKSYLKYYSSYAYRDNGRILFSNDYDTEEYNYPEKDWYLLGKNTTERVAWTDPFFDPNSNTTILTAAVPFYNNNKFQGVVSATINLTNLQQKVADIHVGNSGYAFLLDRKGNLIAGKDNEHGMDPSAKENAQASWNQLSQSILSSSSGVLNLHDENGINNVYFQTVPDTSWKLAIVIPHDELYGQVNRYLKISIMVSVFFIAFVILVIYVYSLYMTNSIKKVHILSKAISEGDLTKQIHVESVDEFGQMGTGLNAMTNQLQTILSQVALSAKGVYETSVQLSHNSEQSAKATEAIAQSIQEVASGTLRQLDVTSEAANAASDMLGFIHSISQRVDHANQSAQHALTAAQLGKADILDAISQMDLISQNSAKSVALIRHLEEKSKQINEIMRLLSSIAKQTKLLALNAGVIASQAGANGKTFAVISQEIRLLAEHSTKSGSEIDRLIAEIQACMVQAVEAMKEGDSSVQDGRLLIRKAGDSFTEILQLVEGVSGESREMESEVKRFQLSVEEIAASMKAILHVYEQSASETQYVSAITEEQTAAIEEVASYSSELAHMAKAMERLAASFKLYKETEGE
ncbi:methyl-accepting chemotaxis protein [Paenibacillus hexagrammi]|uniref:Methyl-accepting chemotaxis protein n=1 Tax=Paenibacillus hexagrammi TaxID=2908839 RepID=A0ABY3SL10_9BACL|nr:methyl-accepting chemotaxis protein [Paenibacillus sp. YPD9-1]UJF34646.1 methyl-accepting chemotaxis protein [Paenibacillus sp. YPD9-1]